MLFGVGSLFIEVGPRFPRLKTGEIQGRGSRRDPEPQPGLISHQNLPEMPLQLSSLTEKMAFVVSKNNGIVKVIVLVFSVLRYMACVDASGAESNVASGALGCTDKAKRAPQKNHFDVWEESPRARTE